MREVSFKRSQLCVSDAAAPVSRLTVPAFLLRLFLCPRNSGDPQECVVSVSIPDQKLLVWWDGLGKQRETISVCCQSRLKSPVQFSILADRWRSSPIKPQRLALRALNCLELTLTSTAL